MKFFVCAAVTHLSQHDPADKLGFNNKDYNSWSKRLCGLACLAMILDAYRTLSVSVAELTRQGVALGGYNNTYGGWLYTPLVRLARSHGLHGQTYREADTATITTKLLKNRFFVASVNRKVLRGEPSHVQGGHLVLIVGVKLSDDQPVGFYMHDPAEKSGPTFITIELFEQAFGQRGFSVWR